MWHAHIAWLLVAIFVITWSSLFLAFRFWGLTSDKFGTWGALLSIASLAAWVALRAMDNPYSDFVMAFLLSFMVALEWNGRYERRSGKRAT